MNNRWQHLAIGFVLICPSVLWAQQQPQPKTIPESINFIWKDVAHDFIALADAMPQNKWNFTPTQGQFKGVRTFAEQIKHVACSNEEWPSRWRVRRRRNGATSAVRIPTGEFSRSTVVTSHSNACGRDRKRVRSRSRFRPEL